MSLKVWLPLDGSLNQQGASSIEATDTNLTLNTSGKIGSCYSFNGSNSYIMLSEAPFSNSTTEFSYTCWVKFTSLSSCCLFSNRTALQYTGITIFVNNSGNILFDAGNERRTKSYTFATNIWYHLAFTYKKGDKKKIYINGTEIDSVTSTGSTTAASATNAFIGASQNSNTTVNANYLNGQLNDIRIYDHCLSAAEVHEISQGLVLHYKLDSILNNNMLKYIPRLYSPDAYNAYQFDLTENLVAGQTYTFQFWDIDVAHSGKTAEKLGISVYWGGGNINLKTMNGTSYFTNGHADHLQFTITITENLASGTGAGNAKINIYNSVSSAAGTLNMHIGAWKVEKGTVATAWGLTPEESESMIVDSSGYGHNGTIVNTPSLVNSQARYTSNIHFSSNNQHIQLPAITYSNFGNSFTIAWWGRRSTHSNMMFWGFSNGNRLNGMYNGTLWNTGDGSNNPIQQIGTTTTITAPTASTWHHYVMTGDGTNSYLYVNGVLYGKAKTYKGLTGTQIFLNGWANGTSYSSNDMDLSDFRIYATALFADDIKQLYEVGAKVDNNNNIHTFELNETISKINQNVTFSATISNPNVTIKTYKTASSPAPRTTNHSILSPSQLTETSLIPIQLGDKYFISINECTITPYTYNYQSSFWKRTGSSTYQKTTDPRRYGQYAREYIYIEYYDEEQNLLGQKFVKSTIKQTESTYNESYTPQQYPPVNCIASLPDTKFPEFSSAKYIKICIQKDGSTVANGNVTSIIKEVQPKIKLFKNGILQTRQFIENAQAKFYPLSSIEGNNLIEF